MNKLNPDVANETACKLILENKLDAAVKILTDIIAKYPKFIDAYNNLGMTLTKLDKVIEAKNVFIQGLKINNNHARLHNNLATILNKMGNFKDTVYHLTKAVKLDPKDPLIVVNFARTLKSKSDIQKAKEILDNLHKNNKATADSLAELADIYLVEKKTNTALELLEQALKIQDNNYHALSYMATIKSDYNQQESLISTCEKLLNYYPLDLNALALLTKATLDIGDFKILTKHKIRTKNLSFGNLKKSINPFLAQILNVDIVTQNQIAKQYAANISNYKEPTNFKYNCTKNNKLKIGYISADFGNHPVAMLFEFLPKNHDRNKFEVFCFSTKKHQDKRYHNIVNSVDKFLELENESPATAAQQINNLKIDILIDLTGPMAYDNFDILALKPSPVQCHWLGYTGSLGAEFIQYNITTETVVPKKLLPHCSETQVYLKTEAPCPNFNFIDINKLKRSNYNLPEDALVLFAQHSSYRIDELTFNLWLNILKNTSNTVLWLQCENETRKNNYIKYALARGIDSQRLIFIEEKKLDYTGHHRLADLFLDSTVFTSGTLSLLCASANVPMLSYLGDTPQTRVSASYNKALHPNSLIADSVSQMEAMAIEVLKDKNKVLELKRNLANSQHNSILFNQKAFSQHFENALEKIWQHYCDKSDNNYINVEK